MRTNLTTNNYNKMERKAFINSWIEKNAKDFMRTILKSENPVGVIMVTMTALAIEVDNKVVTLTKEEFWTKEAKLIVLNELWGTINERFGCR
jgi:hypothetical protein